jgi:DNA-binding response OmpR family regulator
MDHRMRILVVEDERLLGSAIAMALRAALDADVDVAHDGQTALRLASEHGYALTLLDWWLPPPTGLDLLQRWRGHEQIGPIVVMSGGYDGPERDAAFEAGASLFLEKPFSLTELVSQARTLLREAH